MSEKNGTLPRLDILEALANHLISGKLNHAKFIFGNISEERTIPNEKIGEAISELPFLFPEEFEFYGYYSSRKVLRQNIIVSKDTANYIFGFDKITDPKMKFQNLGNILCSISYYFNDFKQPKPKEVGRHLLSYVKRYKKTYKLS